MNGRRPVRDQVDTPKHSGTLGDASADLESDRNRLATRLAEIRRQRMADEVQANQLPQLLRAIVLARRNRDGGMTCRLRHHRAQLERVMADAEDLLVSSIRANLLIAARQLDEDDPVVHQVRRAAQRGRDAVEQLNRALAEALL